MLSWIDKALDLLLWPWDRWSLPRVKAAFVASLDARDLDGFLETLLRYMRLVLIFDRDFARNIEDYEVSYVFRTIDDSVVCSAIFTRGRMKVRRRAIADPDITVSFRDAKAIKDFLFDENPDIIGAIVDNAVTYEGNVNYLSKLVYMAKHLQLDARRTLGHLSTKPARAS